MANNLPLMTWSLTSLAYSGTGAPLSTMTDVYNWFNGGNSAHFDVDEVWTGAGSDLMFTLKPRSATSNVPNMRIGFMVPSAAIDAANSPFAYTLADKAYAFCTSNGSGGYDNIPTSGEIYTSVDWSKAVTMATTDADIDGIDIIECEEAVTIVLYDTFTNSSTYGAMAGAIGHKDDGVTRRYMAMGSGAGPMTTFWDYTTSLTAYSPVTAGQMSNGTYGGVAMEWDERSYSGARGQRGLVYTTTLSRTSDESGGVNIPVPILNYTQLAFGCFLRQIYMGPPAKQGQPVERDGTIIGYNYGPSGPSSTTLTPCLKLLNE